MSITPHVMAGMVTAVNFERLRVKQPSQKWFIYTLMCLTSFVTHLLLDRIPHFDYLIYAPDKFEDGLKLFVDAALALLIIKFIFEFWASKNGIPDGPKILDQIIPALSDAGPYWIFALAVFCCLAPDVEAVVARTFPLPLLVYLSNLHAQNHTSIIPGMINGLITQAIATMALAYWLRKSLDGLYKYKIARMTETIGQEVESCLRSNRHP